ncbi:protein NOI4 isoform X1 [Pyrus x bretschneideri]|uniref:protein NOI4 isoform X1 n=1 Tax=Pyrus x bretschneideri TaxID=225117 RepID=UPI0020308F7E|nr:protein NOI4 isoform X1 [Pyrus x bretschneideri]
MRRGCVYLTSSDHRMEKGVPLPKFGEWDVNDPASAEGFTVIFNKARNEKKTGGRPDSPSKEDRTYKQGAVLGKPPSKKWFCCLCAES